MQLPKLAAVLWAAVLLSPLSAARAREPSGGEEPGARAVAPIDTDRTIDLDLVKADVRNVLRLFAEISGMNFVFGEEVDGQVTIRLKGVRWEPALRAILRIKGLEMVREGNIVRIARAEKLAAEREAALRARNSCLESGKPRTRLIPVNHARAEAMAELVRARLSERGRVTVDTRTNTLIVTDVECP